MEPTPDIRIDVQGLTLAFGPRVIQRTAQGSCAG